MMSSREGDHNVLGAGSRQVGGSNRTMFTVESDSLRKWKAETDDQRSEHPTEHTQPGMPLADIV